MEYLLLLAKMSLRSPKKCFRNIRTQLYMRRVANLAFFLPNSTNLAYFQVPWHFFIDFGILAFFWHVFVKVWHFGIFGSKLHGKVKTLAKLDLKTRCKRKPFCASAKKKFQSSDTPILLKASMKNGWFIDCFS